MSLTRSLTLVALTVSLRMLDAAIQLEDLRVITATCVDEKLSILDGLIQAQEATVKSLDQQKSKEPESADGDLAVYKAYKSIKRSFRKLLKQQKSTELQWAEGILAQFKAYKQSIKRNFLKCSFWDMSVDDITNAVFPDSFMTPAMKTMEEGLKEDVRGLLKVVPIKTITDCVRRWALPELGVSPLSEDDNAQFKEYFGKEASAVGDEVLLTVLRTSQCHDRQVSPRSKDLFAELQKSTPAYYLDKVKYLWQDIYDWTMCMYKARNAKGIGMSDMLGLNGHWDFWNGPACLERLKANKPKSEAAPQWATIPSSDDMEVMTNGTALTSKLWRRARGIFSKWLKGNESPKKESASASPQDKDKVHTRRRRGNVSCIVAFCATIILIVVLTCYGAGAGVFASLPTGLCHFGFSAGAAILGFLVGLVVGLFLTYCACD